MTRRDAGILGGFLAVIAVVVGIYVWQTTRVPASATTTASRTGHEKIDIASAANDILTESRVAAIAGAGLFEPLIVESGQAERGSLVPIPVETKAVVDVTDQARASASGGGASGGPKPPGPAPSGPPVEGGPPAEPPAPPTPPAAIDVAITGVIIGGKTVRVLVESNSLGKSEWTDVPGEAFGYRVRYATVKGAVIEKDGRTYVLILGANKKRSAKEDYPVAGAGAAGPSNPAPPPPQPGAQGPTPEQMRQAQGARWQGRRGRGGPGGGRGGPGGGPAPAARVEMKAG